MKKSLLALAIFGAFAGAASAQSSVTIYGVVDLGVNRLSTDGGNKTSMQTNQSGSRLGFKGTEDLGNGLKANFVLENGFEPSDGRLNQGGRLFGRQAWVGLSGGFGEVRLGRQDTPIFIALDDVDPFGTYLAGDSSQIFTNLGAIDRSDNLAYYKTPSFGGFTVEGSYKFGETAGDTTLNSAYGVVAGYENGPALFRLGYNLTEGTIDDSDTKDFFVGGTYDFGVVKAHGAFSRSKSELVGTTVGKYNMGMLGLSAPVGVGTVMFSVLRRQDKLVDEADSTLVALGYSHPLSKRTNLYTSVGHTKNDDNVALGGAVINGESATNFNVGIRHKF